MSQETLVALLSPEVKTVGGKSYMGLGTFIERVLNWVKTVDLSETTKDAILDSVIMPAADVLVGPRFGPMWVALRGPIRDAIDAAW